MDFFKTFFLVVVFMTGNAVFADKPKVVVVGAGIAGLTTAYRLQQQGVDVEVYEARGRVGGRIFSVQVGGHTTELGGLNITDGGEAEHIYRLIKEFDLGLVETKLVLNYSYFTGEELIPAHQLLMEKQFNPEVLKSRLNDFSLTSHNMKEILRGILEEDDLLYKALATRMAAYEGATIDKLSPFYAKTLFHMLLGGTCEVHQEDAVTLLSIRGGNALLPTKIAQMLGEHVHLNMQLARVEKDARGAYVLTFNDGQVIKADIVVLTMPCSVYDQISIEKNIIPSERLEDIKSVQYGTNAKIVIPVSNPCIKGTVCVNDRIIGFLNSARDILTLYYTGQSSFFSADSIQNAYGQEIAMLEMGYGKECLPSAQPVYARDPAFAVYEGAVGYSWPNDPYAKGSYSYISPGQETLLTELKEDHGEMVKTLFAPIDQTLYFAGEHTSILMDVPGTMEAACESGERTARMILKSL